MREITFSEAVVEAYQQEMRRDEDVVVMGIDVKASLWGTTKGLFEEFGPRRVINTPVCEGSFTMAGIGAALTGLRPVVQISFADFMYLAMDSVVNTAAPWHYVSGGKYKVPLVIEAYSGARGHGMFSHSQSPQASFLNSPGLKMVIPATPADAKGLMAAAIRDDGPVIFFSHRLLLATKGDVPQGEHVVPIGRAEVRRRGDDVTIVSYGAYLHHCLDAADVLAREGVKAEIIDLKTLVPFDEELVAASVKKTTRLMIVEDGRKRGGIGSEVAACIAENHIDVLDGPILRIAALDTPVPFSTPLEKAHLPQTEKIVAEARALVGK